MCIRVALADDHELVRACVRTLLAGHGVEVVSEAADGRALIRDVRRHRPDVALVDVSMPMLDGIEATRRLTKAFPSTRVVVLTMHDDRTLACRAASAGAWGYCTKDDTPEQLVDTVERVAAGERCLPSGGAVDDDPLSAREREVLQLIAEGRKNREIAEIMSRSIHTVRGHRARLMGKLGVRSAPELIRAATEQGLLRWPV